MTPSTIGRVIALYLPVMLAHLGCGGSRRVPIVDLWANRYPLIELSNQHASVLLMKADEALAFNTASRFDRAGMVLLARTAAGHAYFGPIIDRDRHDPGRDDHVAGTAGEYGMTSPLGYEEAGPGESFVKIGIGVLRRTDDKPYFFRRDYPLVDGGRWRIESTPVQSIAVQAVDGPRGWGYEQRTRVALLPDRPGFVIERTLTNTGTQPFATDYYCHNFVLLDGQEVSPDYTLSFRPAHAVAPGHSLPASLRFEEGQLRLRRPLAQQQSIWLPLISHDEGSAPWRATWSHLAGATISVEQQPKPDRVVIYMLSPYLSVEPFTDIKLRPGESFTLTATYHLQ